MTFDEVQRRLEVLLQHGLPHEAWDLALAVIQGRGSPGLRRALKFRVLPGVLASALPSSFWDARRREEARRMGVTPPKPAPRVGEVSFPVVFPTSERNCLIAATVRLSEATTDELPSPETADEEARQAMAEALEAARRLSGERRRFHVVLQKPFPEPVKGASCGLAVGLAALSCLEGREVSDTVVATGTLTREQEVRPVRDVPQKLALCRKARPLARLLCPASAAEGIALVPVSRLDDAKAAIWAPNPQAQEEALDAYKHACATRPALLRLDLSRLANISRGEHETELKLLDFAVPPSLNDDKNPHEARVAKLRRRQGDRNLSSAERQAIDAELERLDDSRWDPRGLGKEPSSLAAALGRHPRLAVIGEPGAGKSLLTRLTFLACTNAEAGGKARELLIQDDGYNHEAVKTVQALSGLLPVLIPLGASSPELAKEGAPSLEDLIRRQLREQGARHALLDGLGGLLSAGKVFLICDGLDEVPEDQRGMVVERISGFAGRYLDVRVLVTSRPHGYQPRIRDFAHVQLAPLNERQQRMLVARLHHFVEAGAGADALGVERARRRTNSLLRAIQSREQWRKLAANPLLLTLSALVRADEDGVPEHQVLVFEGFVKTLVVQWRASQALPREDAMRLLDAWSEAALGLVQMQRRHGTSREQLLGLLDQALGSRTAGSRLDGKLALRVALDKGLVSEDGDTIKFWHPSLGEYLAARELTRKVYDVTARILGERHLTPLVLRFAAARLDHAVEAYEEADRLAQAWLDGDEHGDGLLRRPGLRLVSSCISEGVRFDSKVIARVWTTWAELLEQAPPSPLWRDFALLAEHAPWLSLPLALVPRFARLDDRNVRDMQEALARLVAPSAGAETDTPEVRAACERWFEQRLDNLPKFLGAFGLASLGVWNDDIIGTLGRFGTWKSFPPRRVGALVRHGGRGQHPRFEALVARKLASDERSSGDVPKEEQETGEQRLSAACLLAAAGLWSADVARVLGLALAGRNPRSNRADEAATVVTWLAADDKAVQESLLGWLAEDDPLGQRARDIVRDVAPLVEDMPEAVLRRTAAAEGRLLDQLEELLIQVAWERRALLDTLWRWLEDAQVERRRCAARILRRLTPRDERLHAALRRGMEDPAPLERLRWAHLAIDAAPSLSEAALALTLDCLRSTEGEVRALAHQELIPLKEALGRGVIEQWVACALDAKVSSPARLDVVLRLFYPLSKDERLRRVLRELVDDADAAVRARAAVTLLHWEEVDERVADLAAESLARPPGEDEHSIFMLTYARPFAAIIVKRVLDVLTHEPPEESDAIQTRAGRWAHTLSELVVHDVSCMEHVLDALEGSSLAGEVALDVLSRLLGSHPPMRNALRERLGREDAAMSRHGWFRSLMQALGRAETRPAAVEAFRRRGPRDLNVPCLLALAPQLAAAGARDEAIRLWRRVLEGGEPEPSLEAAEDFVIHCPEEAGTWVQPVIDALLDAPVPAFRMRAGRIAVRYGFFQEKTMAALVACTHVNDPLPQDGVRRRSGWGSGTWFIVGANLDRNTWLQGLHEYGVQKRIDFCAMYALCARRPEVGLPQLVRWLDDEDASRFRSAVATLSRCDDHRETVGAALLRQLRSRPIKQLFEVVYLLEEHGLYSEDVVEVLLDRLQQPESPHEHELGNVVVRWMWTHPEIWSVLRRQDLPRRIGLMHLLHRDVPPITPDAVAFAVEATLSVGRGSGSGEGALQRIRDWCAPRKEAAPQALSSRYKPLPVPPPETVRDWVRQRLLEIEPPTAPDSISYFDALAEQVELPMERRLAVLRGALDVKATASENGDALHTHACQQRVALQLLSLGAWDERIPQVLNAAMHVLLEAQWPSEAFRIAYHLFPLRAADLEARNALVRATITHWGYLYVSLTDILEVLARAGLDVEARIDVLLACLDIGNRPAWLEEALPGGETPPALDELQWLQAPGIFDALEALGCTAEQRTALLDDFLRTHEVRLPPQTTLKLAARKELSEASFARLLLGVLARGDHPAKDAAQAWVERFARGTGGAWDEDRWWFREGTTYLGTRLSVLARLSRVDDPRRMTGLLSEVISAPEGLPSLYERARAGAVRSDAEWRELTSRLHLSPSDDAATSFARQLLALGLWQASEPLALEAALRA